MGDYFTLFSPIRQARVCERTMHHEQISGRRFLWLQKSRGDRR